MSCTAQRKVFDAPLTYADATISNLIVTPCSCKDGDCLRSLGDNALNLVPSYNTIQQCRKCVAFMSVSEKTEYLLNKIIGKI